MKKRCIKKGITLVEVVVAMALVVIISIAGFSVVNFSIRAGNKSKIQNFFMVELQNYVTAIMSGAEGYSSSMFLLTNENYNYGENGAVYYSNDLTVTYEDNAKYCINISFDTTPYSIACYDIQNNLIYSVEV